MVVSTHDERMIPLADTVVELVPKFLDDRRDPEPVDLAAGEVLFAQGSWGDLVYVVESGEIDIVRVLGPDREETLITLQKGAYFGETGPLFGLPRSATARAKADARVTAYTVRSFRDHVDGKTPPTFSDDPL